MDSGHASSSAAMETHQASTSGKGHDLTADKRVNSSASSSSAASSKYEDPIDMDTNEIRKSNADASDTAASLRHGNKDTQLASRCSEDGIGVSCSMPRHDEPGDGAVMQSPPRQAMERADHDTGAASPSTYRIPSYVFARTISTAPYEWSVASNESLFSIHPGNMSFTGDQLYLKSGELCLAGEYAMTMPGSSTEHTSNRPSTNNKSTEVSQKCDDVDAHFGVSEATAAETMREVIRENEEDHNKVIKSAPPNHPPVKELPPSVSDHSHHQTPSLHSNDSIGSVKSFAFPILTGNVDKSGSSKNASKDKKPKQPQSQPETPKVVPQSKNPEGALKESKEKENAAAAPPQGRWCACFSCCPFCTRT